MRLRGGNIRGREPSSRVEPAAQLPLAQWTRRRKLFLIVLNRAGGRCLRGHFLSGDETLLMLESLQSVTWIY